MPPNAVKTPSSSASERERAVYFYEMLSGVYNDDNSKIIRYVCFVVLFLGMMWAGYNYFRATVLANTEVPIDPDMFADTVSNMPGNESALSRIADLAQAVDSMRSAGETIASTLDGIHNMPFNLDPEGSVSNLAGTGATMAPGTPGSQPPDNQPKAGPLTVRMIMTAENGQKIAVVDAGGKKAVVVRRGDKLPNEAGFVSSIKDREITVIFNKQETKYELPEIHRFDEFSEPGKNFSGAR